MGNTENWFGQRVKLLRERAGITQLRLSEEMDVSLQTVREWERGAKFPHIRRLPLLARTLGVEVGQFFPATGYGNPWPQIARDGNPDNAFFAHSQLMDDIERHLTSASQQFRKLRNNAQPVEPDNESA